MDIAYCRTQLHVKDVMPYAAFFERILGFRASTLESGDAALEDYAILSRGSYSIAFVRNLISKDVHSIAVAVDCINDAAAALRHHGFEVAVSHDVTEGAFFQVSIADQLHVTFEEASQSPTATTS